MEVCQGCASCGNVEQAELSHCGQAGYDEAGADGRREGDEQPVEAVAPGAGHLGHDQPASDVGEDGAGQEVEAATVGPQYVVGREQGPGESEESEDDEGIERPHGLTQRPHFSRAVLVGLVDVDHRHGDHQHRAGVHAKLHQVGEADAEDLESEDVDADQTGDEEHDGAGHHGQVVGPGQEEDAGVVLFPVRGVEAEQGHPHQHVHPESRDGESVGFVDAEDVEKGAGDEDGGPRVASVVKELAQGRAVARTPRLLPVYPVQRVGEKKEDGGEKPRPPGNGRPGGQGRRLEVVVVDGRQKVRRDAASEAHQGEQVGGDPSGTQQDDPVPKWVEHVDAERIRVLAVVLVVLETVQRLARQVLVVKTAHLHGLVDV